MIANPPPPTDWELAQAAREHALTARAGAFKSLRTAADTVEVIAWFVGVLGVLGGVLVALIGEDDGFGPDRHPYVGVGVGAAASSVVLCAVLVLFARWAQAWRHANETPA